MTWYGLAWLLLSTAIAIALLVVVAWNAGWFPLVFALLVGGLTFLLARRWAKRRVGSR